MENQNNLISDKYLYTFDKILCNMSNKMLSFCMTKNITVNFINCMIPHHEAAIYMSKNLIEFCNFKPLINICEEIIKMQTSGIENMIEILKTTLNYTNFEEEIYCYNNMYFAITKNMIFKMQNAPRCIDVNLDFINEMIPHHEGALAMCTNLLKYCVDPRLQVVAKSIIDQQSKGINDLVKIHKEICKECRI